MNRSWFMLHCRENAMVALPRPPPFPTSKNRLSNYPIMLKGDLLSNKTKARPTSSNTSDKQPSPVALKQAAKVEEDSEVCAWVPLAASDSEHRDPRKDLQLFTLGIGVNLGLPAVGDPDSYHRLLGHPASQMLLCPRNFIRDAPHQLVGIPTSTWRQILPSVGCRGGSRYVEG